MNLSAEEKTMIKFRIEKLKNSSFKQQSFASWQETPSIERSMIIAAFFAILFLGIGLTLYFVSSEYQEVSIRYDDRCIVGDLCRIHFDIDIENCN